MEYRGSGKGVLEGPGGEGSWRGVRVNRMLCCWRRCQLGVLGGKLGSEGDPAWGSGLEGLGCG